MRELALPEKFLAEINRKRPSLWREVDFARAENGFEWLRTRMGQFEQ